MSETRVTAIYGGAALVLLLFAFLAAPRTVTPEEFVDRGEAFFPEFDDPNKATTLEVIEFDEETASAKPFKVTFKEGLWTIPSHHDYPADGKDRLAKTAAGVIGINKDDYRSNNVSDHEAFGVIDPLDEAVTSLQGRGKRVTIKDEGENVLADFIVGKQVEDRAKFRFVRIPGQKRVYAARVDLDLSTKFADWIEADLLEVEKSSILGATLKDYTINERTGFVNQRDTLVLSKQDDDWKANRMSASQEVDSTKMADLIGAVDDLNIVGVRRKPEGLSVSLSRSEGNIPLTQEALISLQQKGYYFTRDGSLLSNEGELQTVTDQGITYTLRFGEVLYGSGDAITAGSGSSDTSGSGPGENRYLFITTSFDSSQLPEPPQPKNTDFSGKEEKDLSEADKANKQLKEKHDEWQEKIENSRKRNEELNQRFANWYYVISSESFDKLRLTRKDLVKRKDS